MMDEMEFEGQLEDEADEGMTLDDLQAALQSDYEDAVSFIDSDIAPSRELATRFYQGLPFGDEEDGRSQVVMPVVRDTVRSTLPSLMKIFFGGQRVLEFIGTNGVAAEIANEMTEGVEYVFRRQNDGWTVCWNAFKDALVRKVGFIKWYWDDSVSVKSRIYDGVTEEQLMQAEASLKHTEELEVVSATIVAEPEQYSYKIRITSREPCNRVKVCAVPPEEIVIDRWATSDRDFRLFGHRTMKTRGELAAMGIPLDEELFGGTSGEVSLELNTERLVRQPAANIIENAHETEDQQKVLFCDLFYRVDFDGDGISELLRVMTVGPDMEPVYWEPVEEPNIAMLCPDPEPHVVFGLSQADNVMDIQLIESHMTRDILDSTKASIFPRVAYVEGQVNSDDVLNTEIGAAIRMRQPGMVQPLATPFVGKEAMPMLDWLDAIKERRTGVRGSSPALDAKALQSTNQVAVNAAVTGAQQQVELIARIFAETGMKRVFRGIAKLLVQYQQQPLEAVVNGQPVKLDPRNWNLDAEMEVQTGLGTGQNEQKLAALAGAAAAQTLALDKLGLNNPLCDLTHLYNTQVRILELNGIRDTHRFWRDPTTFEPPPPEPPEPTPEETLANAQMEIEAGKLELERLKVILQDDRERDKLDADVMLKAAEIRAKYGTAVDVAAISAQVERARSAAEDRRHAEALKVQAAKNSEGGKPVVVNVQSPPAMKKVPVRDDAGRVIEVRDEPI